MTAQMIQRDELDDLMEDLEVTLSFPDPDDDDESNDLIFEDEDDFDLDDLDSLDSLEDFDDDDF